MKPDDLLESLKVRFRQNKSGRILITADEIADWPAGLFEKFLADKILRPAEPTQSVECQGCEQACIMPVTVIAAEGSRPARAFIACDKRDDVGRVPVNFSRMHQWHMTQSDFQRLERTWVVTPRESRETAFRKTKAPVTFRNALENLLTEIERRAEKHELSFDRRAMPGRKVDFQAVADKFDSTLEHTPRTFDDYLEGLCAFKRGARQSSFYSIVFPEYFK